MFQISKDIIRPHRRVTIPVQSSESIISTVNEGESKLHPVQYSVFWDIPQNLETKLDEFLMGWFKVEITVRGESVSISIDDKTVFIEESFLKNSSGKIGFRNYGPEKALVRRVRLSLIT